MSYIHPDARESYRHWWEQQTYWMLQPRPWQPYISLAEEIGYLYPHLRPPRKLRYRRGRWGDRKPYLRRWDISTSGESRFVQEGYETKEIDQSREDWRERKGFAKDQSKHRTWCKCRRHLKTRDHRERRRWERAMIHAERWMKSTSTRTCSCPRGMRANARSCSSQIP